MFRSLGSWSLEKLLLVGSLAWSLIVTLPQRLWRIVLDVWHAVTGVLGWLAAMRSGAGNTTWGAWWRAGLRGGLIWSGRVLLHLVELVGLGEALQLVWGLIFRLRPLTAQERAASAAVHPAGLIPYWQVRVADDSYLITIGVMLARLLKTTVTPGAVTSMHIIHAPAAGLSMPLAVHELTHVGQYERVGAAYMLEALHAQGSAAGYDYGDLTTAWTAGTRFTDLNREQQASICTDYYRVCHGRPAEFGAIEAELAPFISDMRSGRF
ncbi:MAG TPA: hypothetical protein VJT72_21555 [Pseudonocardiaceae bacterium]|nr:hypothetical protein [Pseudonocardiaceae bacterium]